MIMLMMIMMMIILPFMTKGRKRQIELFIVSESLNSDEHFYLGLISKALFKENMGQLKKDTKRQGVLVNNSRPKDKGDASSFFCQKKIGFLYFTEGEKDIRSSFCRKLFCSCRALSFFSCKTLISTPV